MSLQADSVGQAGGVMAGSGKARAGLEDGIEYTAGHDSS